MNPVAVTSALIVSGMHRSGTSLLASLVEGAGVSLGTRLIGPSRGNERGHFEDLDFYEIHARSLEANGVPEHGFTLVGELTVPPEMRSAAAQLVAAKAAAGAPWGWKDPRTCLFLDFWAELLPESRFLFVVRSPWEVVDSLFRRGDETFATHPLLAARVWLHYNRRIHEFVVRHPTRCLLVAVEQVVAEPARVFAAARRRLGFPLGEPPVRYEEGLLARRPASSLKVILEAVLPEATELHVQMCRLAESSLGQIPTALPRSAAAA
ncbi:MAG: hypothetical protein FJ286_02935 [Planctomycetes bacterium]|nr:hypothetical protein [Planctomycetota bacterium]